MGEQQAVDEAGGGGNGGAQQAGDDDADVADTGRDLAATVTTRTARPGATTAAVTGHHPGTR